MEVIVVLTLLIFTLVGYLLARPLLSDKTSLLLLPISFGIGAGVIAMELYLFSRIGLSWSIVFIMLPWIIFFGLLLWRRVNLRIHFIRPSLAKYDIVLVVCIALLLLFVAFESTLRPVVAWDAWAIWLLKSKIFFLDSAIQISIFRYVESSYPILVSLMSTFIYVSIGHIDDRSVLLLSFAFYFMLGISFFAYLWKNSSLTYALFGTFILLSIQNILRHGGRLEAGQADIIMAFYMSITGMLLLDFMKKNNVKKLIVLQLLLGITALIKNEGMVYSIFVQIILIYSFIKVKSHKLFLTSLIWLIPVVDWELFKISNNIPKLSNVFIGNAIHVSSVYAVVLAMVQEMLNIQNWNLLWIIFSFVVVVYNVKLIKSPSAPIYLLIFFQLSFYFLLYMIFPGEPVDLVNSSFNRLLLQLAPLALLISLIEIYPRLRTLKQAKKFI